PMRRRVVGAGGALAKTSGAEAIDGVPAPMGSVGRLGPAKCLSVSQTPSSPLSSAISATENASSKASSWVRRSRHAHSITRPAYIACSSRVLPPLQYTALLLLAISLTKD